MNTGYALMLENEGHMKIVRSIDDNIYDCADANVLEYVYENFILKKNIHCWFVTKSENQLWKIIKLIVIKQIFVNRKMNIYTN